MATKLSIDLETLTSEMDDLKKDKARYEFELKQIKEEIEKREREFIALLRKTGTDAMSYKYYSWQIKKTVRNALDQKLLKEKYPKEFEECYIAKESEKFEFKINK